MADKETNDAIQSTALAVVESQQRIVGGALVGSTGAGVLDQGSQAEFDVLEQIRDLQLKTVRGIGEFVKKLDAMLGMEKDAARREKEDANELAKENQGQLTGPASDVGGDTGDNKEAEDKAKGLGAFASFMAGLPGVAQIGKFFAPILGFLGKGGILFKTFGMAGPLGAIILGVTLLVKYSKEISAALAPALDGLKTLFTKLKPAIDVLMTIGDFLIKGIIEGIGQALSFVIGTVETFIDGFTKLFSGDIIGGLTQIFEGIVRTILTVPLMIINFLTPLFNNIVDLIAEPWNNMVNSIHESIGNIFTSISDFFFGMVDSVKNFFVTAWENGKAQVTSDINGMIDFVTGIFGSIGSAVTEFVTSIPKKVMSGISNIFSPIIDFFAGIGNRIKEAVNGIIDSLPIPNFVKKRIKFDVPTETEETELTGDASLAEKIALDQKNGMETIAGKYQFKDGVLQENGQNFEAYSSGFANAVAREIGDQVKTAIDTKTGKYVVVKSDLQLAERPGTTTITGPDNLSDVLGTDSLATNVKTPSVSVPTGETGGNTPIIIQKGGDTNNATVTSKSETYTGPLDTGIDPYHERTAFNYG